MPKRESPEELGLQTLTDSSIRNAVSALFDIYTESFVAREFLYHPS
jgi:hypothetical protein